MATTVIPPKEEKLERTGNPRPLVKVYVWQLPVRYAHWMMALALILLCFTGTYIHNPFFVSHSPRAYVMGQVRFIHLCAGWLLIMSFLLRTYYFVRGNMWAKLRAYVPLTRRQRDSLKTTFLYYSFFRGTPFDQVGHNALAALAYLGVYTMVFVEIVTGLVLFGIVRQSPWLWAIVKWVPWLINDQYLRLVHFCTMFAFGMFFIHHIYSALLTAHEERNGLMESIFTGYKLVAPELVHEEIEAGQVQSELHLLPGKKQK